MDRGHKKDPYAKAKESIEKTIKKTGIEHTGKKFRSKEYVAIGPKRKGHFKKAKTVAMTVGKSKKAGRTY